MDFFSLWHIHARETAVSPMEARLLPFHQDTLAWRWTIYLHLGLTGHLIKHTAAFPEQLLWRSNTAVDHSTHPPFFHWCSTPTSFTDIDVHLFPSMFDAPFSSFTDAGWLLFVSGWTWKEWSRGWWLVTCNDVPIGKVDLAKSAWGSAQTVRL